MQLSTDDIDLFYKLWLSLLAYVSQRYPETPKINASEDIKQMPLQDVRAVRDKIYAHPAVLDDFTDENPPHLTSDELGIVREWKHFVKGRFIVLRQLKSHAIFVDVSEPPKAYGVLALASPFEEMFALPAMIETTLLPFKGRIITDGLFGYSPVVFGSHYSQSFNDAYQRAKSAYGVITSLPFTPPEERQTDEDLLRFYMKSERNREMYLEEMWELIHKNPSALLPIYHQELGKINVRRIRQTLKTHEVARAWFAILDDVVIASGKTREEISAALDRLIPSEKRGYIYLFEWKP